MEAASVLVLIVTPVTGVALSAVANICSATQPAGFAIRTLLYDSLYPAVLGSAAYLYVVGSVLGIYLPFIPFLIFLATAIGWIISVIESMIAAPLIALGLVWPDAQHEILGRAEPSVMMILNLMLRPSLIVVGLFFGMLVCNFMLKLCNFGFQTMVRYGDLGMDNKLGHFVVLTAYMAAVLVVVTRCFALIHQVPDKVLSWIGDHTQYVGGGEDFLVAAKQGAESGAAAFTGGVSTAVSTHKKEQKAARDKQKRLSRNKPGSSNTGGVR
jgi:conjugal transfer/type IV secretion protein DotA/TraY